MVTSDVTWTQLYIYIYIYGKAYHGKLMFWKILFFLATTSKWWANWVMEHCPLLHGLRWCRDIGFTQVLIEWRFFSVKVSSQWWNVLIRLRWGYYYRTISIPDHYHHLFFNISLSFVDKSCDSASSESVLIWSHLAYWKTKIIEQK